VEDDAQFHIPSPISANIPVDNLADMTILSLVPEMSWVASRVDFNSPMALWGDCLGYHGYFNSPGL